MTPELIVTIADIRGRLAAVRRSGRTIAAVPTMGALHAGHGALMDRAYRESDCAVATIFVNPIQFDRRGDYEAYAVDLARDLEFCSAHGVDLVFAPRPDEMYPSPQTTFVEVTGIQDNLCGRFRPGHFRGVATVVTKLFNILAPDRAYFGEKDAQQLAIIRRMTADLNIPVEIIAVETVREPDGLALSSRNRRLSLEERRAAPALFRALESGRESIAEGCKEASEVIQAVLRALASEPLFRVEYVDVADAGDMLPVERISGPVRVAAAVWLGATRLIDNVFCTAVTEPRL